MLNTVNENQSRSFGLSIEEAQIFAILARASYGIPNKKCGNDNIVIDFNKATTPEQMQLVVNSWLPGNIDSSNPWEVIDIDGGYDGFQGIVVGRKSNTNDTLYSEVAFIFRGTDSVLDAVTADIKILRDRVPGQAKKARAFYNEIMDHKDVYNISENPNITIAGHSMGGSVAQVIGAEKHVRTVTFNASGMGNNISDKTNHNNTYNYVNLSDMVGCYLPPYGKTFYYLPNGCTNDGSFRPHDAFDNQNFNKYKELPDGVTWNQVRRLGLDPTSTKRCA